MGSEERPVHLIVDCSPAAAAVLDSDGNIVPADTPPQVTTVPLTDEEWAEQQQHSEQVAASAAADAEAQAALAAQAAQHPDPLVQELARRAGILP